MYVSFIINDDIMYIKCDIKKSVFKFMKRTYDVKEEVKKCVCNTVYL